MSLPPDHPAAVFLSLLGALWRQKFKALLAFLAIGGATAALWRQAPRSYRSEARLFVRVGRETVALDPTATVGQTIGMQDSRETEINSLMEVLKSRSLHEAIVDELGVAQVLGEQDDSPEAIAEASANASGDAAWKLVSLPARRPSVEALGGSALREKAIQQVSQSLTITSPRRSTVISIDGEASSPRLAQKIVRSLLAAYQQEHIRLHRVPGSFDFFTERAERTQEEVQAALKALNEAKAELSIATVQGRRDHLEKQISNLEELSQTTDAELRSAEAKIASLSTLAEGLPAEIEGVQTTGFSNDTHSRMREQLYALEIRERELLAKYREGHPAVVAHRKQVEEARRILREQPSDRTQREMMPNPAVRTLELDLMQERAKQAALEAKSKTLAQQLLDVASELRDLHHDELHLADLERTLDERKAAHAEAVTRLEQARMNQEMENNRLSNISVIQEATLEEKPISPRLSLFAAAGLAAACLAALGTALAWELVFPPRKARSAD